ncbi:MAG: hypothetical protein H6740_16870 [Alphaproteobacteria bacterium]|nr:hypothetical protein [Alphaproteobacteria bacterium]
MSLPWSLRNLETVLAERPRPTGAPAVDAPWRARWTVHVLSGKPRTQDLLTLGHLEIGFSGAGDEWLYEVSTERQLRDAQLWAQDAVVRCAPPTAQTGHVPALLAWSLESRLSPRKTPEAPALVNGWEQEASGVDGILTCDWALMHAFGRPEIAEASEPFSMLETLEVLRSGLRVQPAGEASLSLGGEPATLRGWRLSGHGVLPTWAWVDPEGRLVAWTEVQRAWVLEAMEAP